MRGLFWGFVEKAGTLRKVEKVQMGIYINIQNPIDTYRVSHKSL